jgi:transcriptional regulator with XRE-family HTH domain
MEFDTFRARLRGLVQSTNKLTRDVAYDMGMTPGSLSRYLTGKREPDIYSLVKIVTYFGVSANWLLGINDQQYDFMTPETKEFSELYPLATPDEQQVIKIILGKYK